MSQKIIKLLAPYAKKFYKRTFALLLLIFLFGDPIINQLYANDIYTGIGRIRHCDPRTGNPQPLDGIDIFSENVTGQDTSFQITNPFCLIPIQAYLPIASNILSIKIACGITGFATSNLPNPAWDFQVMDIAKNIATSSAVDAARSVACSSAVRVAQLSMPLTLFLFDQIHRVANLVNENAQLCGADWMSPNPDDYLINLPDHKRTVQNEVDRLFSEDPSQLEHPDNSDSQEYREWFYRGVEVEDNPVGEEPCLDVTRGSAGGPYPRQRYYMRGTERGNFNCEKYRAFPGQNDPLTGAGFTQSRLDAYVTAYDCCRKRSREYVCIDYNAEAVTEALRSDPTNPLSYLASGTGFIATQIAHALVDPDKAFCKAGSKCTIQGIMFQTKSRDEGRLICAETYNLCPYNFSLGTGSEYCDYYRDADSEGEFITQEELDSGECSGQSEIRNSDCTMNRKAGKCRNYCQVLTNCYKTNISSEYRYTNRLGSPYFAEACVNFVGDSKNQVGYGGDMVTGRQKHFSAPIAQCIKETLENLFYNRAGHSKCLNYNEVPDADGECPSGQYDTIGNFDDYGNHLLYKKGSPVKNKPFFLELQEFLQNTIRMVIALSIMFYGVKILSGQLNFSVGNRKEILLYIFKIAMVLYFATGDAWRSFFFEGVFNASAEFSELVFNIEADRDPKKRDGCQFLDMNFDDGTTIPSGAIYPPGKKYLALWDTLDCKLMIYLGFGPQASISNLVLLVAASFFTGPPGVYIALSFLFLGILFLSAVIRALHIFLSSYLGIVLFVYASPIIIPTLLFSKTKEVFENWLKNLISFTLQPMLLFLYIAIMVMVIDRSLIGSAEFKGSSPTKTISCQTICQNPDGSTFALGESDEASPNSEEETEGESSEDSSEATEEAQEGINCDQPGQRVIHPINDSVACILQFDDYSEFPGLEIIGISIPLVTNLISGDGDFKSILLTLLRGAIIMYLIYKVMDEIPAIVSDIMGGKALPSAKPDASEMFKAMAGAVNKVTSKARRGYKKATKDNKKDKEDKDKSNKQTKDGGNSSTK